LNRIIITSRFTWDMTTHFMDIKAWTNTKRTSTAIAHDGSTKQKAGAGNPPYGCSLEVMSGA